MEPSVSIAMCTYNGARYIDAQVQSILGQSRPADELVVSDDGSTDGTVDAIEAAVAASESPTVLRVLRNATPLGVTRNFQQAIEACGGDLIALSDHDDVWHTDRLAATLPAFEDDSVLLVHGDARLIDGTGSPLGSTLFEALGVGTAERQAVASGRAFETYLRRNLVTGATTMFRARLREHAVPFPTEWVHDEWLGILAAADRGVVMSTAPAVDYRQHGSNQIGVTQPTFGSRLGRMLEPRGDRYVRLAARAALLVERLEAIGAGEDVLGLARRKLRFETLRAGYPAARVARIGPIWRAATGRAYRDLSSQGLLDVARDLLQPR